MSTLWITFFVALNLPILGNSGMRDVTLPLVVKECLQKPEAKGRVKLAPIGKSYFLKGDFDGDKRPDYAIAIKGEKSGRNGVLVCNGKQEVFIMGGDAKTRTPFSDMPDDNFVGPRWRVMPTAEARKVFNYDGDRPVRAAFPKGDSIAFIWEDGFGIIYWNGSRFRWGSGQ